MASKEVSLLSMEESKHILETRDEISQKDIHQIISSIHNHIETKEMELDNIYEAMHVVEKLKLHSSLQENRKLKKEVLGLKKELKKLKWRFDFLESRQCGIAGQIARTLERELVNIILQDNIEE